MESVGDSRSVTAGAGNIIHSFFHCASTHHSLTPLTRHRASAATARLPPDWLGHPTSRHRGGVFA